MNEFHAWLAAKGFGDASALSAEQTQFLQATWRAELNRPAPAPVPAPASAAKADDPTPFDQKLAAIEAETDRIDYIRAATLTALERNVGDKPKCKLLSDLCASAINDPKTDKRAYDIALLRADRDAGPFVYSAGKPQLTAKVLEAAVCRAGQLKTLEKDFSDQTLDAVDQQFRGGIGLMELVGECAKANGFRGSAQRDLRGALRAAFHGDLMASGGPSTLSISGILSNTANKFLREGWMGVETAWREITAIRSVRDFKQITSYSLTGDLAYEKLAPGGEIKHGTLGNETYTNQADTYAKMLGIDRRDLINDDLNALTSVGRRLGRGGALKVNEVFWAEFLADHSTFFPTDYSKLNYDEGTDTAFGADGLTAADVFWQAKTDPDGKPLGLPARILLVPPAHRIPAMRLMSSQNTAKDTDLGTDNPWTGMYRVVSTTYLASSAMGGGYSSKAWYLLADPQTLPVIEVAFLNGVEMPTVETVEMDSDRLGMAMRGYHDFGVNKQEYRAALKLKGEA